MSTHYISANAFCLFIDCCLVVVRVFFWKRDETLFGTLWCGTSLIDLRMSARGQPRRGRGRGTRPGPRLPCLVGWGACGRSFASLSALHQHLDATHSHPRSSPRPASLDRETHGQPPLHSPLAWHLAQPPNPTLTETATSGHSRRDPSYTATQAPVTAPLYADREYQFWRLAHLFRGWAEYASIEDMLGCGLALFPSIPRAYARALAQSVKQWFPPRRDHAVGTDRPFTVDATTDTPAMDDEATNGPPRAMTTPRVYQPLVEDVTPPPQTG